MRVSRIVMAVGFVVLFSCKNAKEAPQNILSKAQMADWMISLYLAEARTSLLMMNQDSAYKLFLPFQDSLMRQKAIQDSTLRKSYDYYLQHPGELESIYDAVIDSLSLREQRLRENPQINQ